MNHDDVRTNNNCSFLTFVSVDCFTNVTTLSQGSTFQSYLIFGRRKKNRSWLWLTVSKFSEILFDANEFSENRCLSNSKQITAGAAALLKLLQSLKPTLWRERDISHKNCRASNLKPTGQSATRPRKLTRTDVETFRFASLVSRDNHGLRIFRRKVSSNKISCMAASRDDVTRCREGLCRHTYLWTFQK